MPTCYAGISVFRRIWDKLKALYRLAISERATPREIGWAVAVGVFAGCTPAVGFHGLLAVAMATALKKNRLFAWLGARISNMVFLPFIALAEIQISHRIRVGSWLELSKDQVLDQGSSLLLDWCLGTIPVGIVLGFLFGVAAYAWARRRDLKLRTPAERLPPSSGSPV